MKPETIRALFLEGATLLKRFPNHLLDARVLLLHAARLDERRFYSDPESPLPDRIAKSYRGLVRKRLAGWPVAYLTGRKEFRSLPFRVTPGVLIPRPETETLIDTVVGLATSGRESILDLGTGSGNIAVALARELARARITAVEISPRALQVAVSNAAANGVPRVRFLRSDLFSAFKNGPALFDIIVSNPPYVGRAAWSCLPREIRDHEPRLAVVGGEKGPEFIRRLVRRSAAFLKPGGHLAVEIGAGQKRAVLAMFGEEWDKILFVRDLGRIPRVVVARLAAGYRAGAISGPRSRDHR